MMANNVSGKYKTAIATGLKIGFGNCGDIITSLIFPVTEASLYRTGFAVCLALFGHGRGTDGGICGGIEGGEWEEEEGGEDYRLGLPQEEVFNLGDDHPDFKFVY